MLSLGAAALYLVLAVTSPVSTDVDGSIAAIKGVGREGAGNQEASKAWRELVEQGPGALPALLAAFDGAGPAAANWLRTAVDAVAEQSVAQKQPLPVESLETFLKDRRHNPAARRLAYECLLRVDRTAAERFLPGMLDDPSTELRRDAVARVVDEAQRHRKANDRTAAKAAFRKAFTGSRDRDQVEEIAKQLEALDEKVDLTAHFGYLRTWQIVGPFDSTGGAGYDRSYSPEQKVDLTATYPGKKGTTVRWAAHTTADKYGLVDLNKVLGKHMGAVAYAFAAVESPGEQPVEIRAGCTNAIKIFLNGRLLFAREEYHHGMEPDQYVAAGTLRAGRNDILLKVCQNEQTEDWAQAWAFQVRVCDAVGGAVPVKLLDEKAKQGTALGVVGPLVCLVAPATDASTTDLDWPQFRGPHGTAVSAATGVPVHWSMTENIRWKVDLPGRGVSCPVVAGGHVYLTACSGYKQRRLHVLCFDAATGRKLWERQLAATGSTMCHPTTCMAAPTPAADGGHVYALFATGDLACFDHDGNLAWYRSLVGDYPNVSNQVGMAASPVVWHDLLFLPLENTGDSFAAALDTRTGANRWKVPRKRCINWVTPTVFTHGGATAALFQTESDTTAYDAETGRLLWTFTEMGPSSVVAPQVDTDAVYVAGGEGGGFAALRPPADGGPPAVLWKSAKLRTAFASTLLHDGRLYTLNPAGVLTCAEAKTGKVVWQHRTKGQHWASPVAADGKIYLVNEEGVATVLQAGGTEPRVLATNALGDRILATPAVAREGIFLRSDTRLYCLGERRERAGR